MDELHNAALLGYGGAGSGALPPAADLDIAGGDGETLPTVPAIPPGPGGFEDLAFAGDDAWPAISGWWMLGGDGD